MPRIERGLADGFIYHVLNRGNGKQKVFHKKQDYRVFVDLMKEAKRRHPVKIFAYCLMPNHFHIVIMAIKAKDLSRFMQWLMTSHVRRYHTHYGTSGHIWQGRFKSFVIQEDSYLLTALRYVERNPVRSGLVESAMDWSWSSLKELSGEDSRIFVDEPPIQLPENWVQFVDEPLTEKELEDLRKSVNRGTPFGESAWQMKVSQKLGLESTLKPRGRPRKRRK